MEKIKCPFCSEEIMVEAKKCRFCGEFLNKSLEKNKERLREKIDLWKVINNEGNIVMGDFLKAKLAFVAFLGVVLTILLANYDKFPILFLIYIIIVLLAFGLLLSDFFKLFSKSQEAKEEINECLFLEYVCYFARYNKNDFFEYDSKANEYLNGENDIYKALKNGVENHKSLDEVIKEFNNSKTPNKWKVNFLLWSVLFLSTPLLFLAYFVIDYSLKNYGGRVAGFVAGDVNHQNNQNYCNKMDGWYKMPFNRKNNFNN